MSKKFEYKVIFNDYCSENSALIYSYGNTNNIKLSIAKNKAVVSFEMTSKKSIDDFINLKVKLFVDAFRKVYLCHACNYSEGLKIRKIIIIIDGEKYVLDKSSSADFPFVYSMISTDKFEFGFDKNKDKISKVISLSTATDVKNDLRIVALYAYLQSKNRMYQIDRFMNLWTSMNAFYNKFYRKTDEYKKNHADNDKNAINNLIKNLGFGCEKPSRKDQKNNINSYKKLTDVISKIDPNEYGKLYMQSENVEHIEIIEICRILKMDCFPLLLLEFPYYLRCEYFHGSQCTLLVSAYNSPELKCLRFVNYFLDRFLSEKIPQLFA